MTAHGQKLLVDFDDFWLIERPLSGKADIQPETLEIGLPNGRYTLNTVEKLLARKTNVHESELL